MGNPESRVQKNAAKLLGKAGNLVIRYSDKKGYPDLIGVPRGSGVVLVVETLPKIKTILDHFFKFALVAPAGHCVLPVKDSTIPYATTKVVAMAFPQGGQSIFWEVKQPGGSLMPHQKTVLAMLEKFGEVRVGAL